jgi:hypothetical protein
VVRIDISYLIDRLEGLVNKSRRVPLTAGIIVNRDECLEIIDQMRITIPQQIEEAAQIKGEREHLLALARQEANRLLDEAKEQADDALDERRLLDQAKKRSATLMEEAQRKAEETMAGADEYAISVLGRLEDQLIAVQTTIRNGLDILQQEDRRRQIPEKRLESSEPDLES